MTDQTRKDMRVSYGACAYGYEVYLMKAGQIEKKLVGGNVHDDSTTVLDPRSLGAISHQTLRKFARQTAIELAVEHHVSLDMVEYDTDIAQSMREEVEGL